MIPGLDIILGGLTGLIGNAFTTWFKYKNAKMEYEHDEKMIGLKTQAMIQASQMQIQITQAEVEGEIEKADSEVFKDSQKYGSQKMFSERWIDMLMEAGKAKWYGWIITIFATLVSAFFAFVDWFNSMMRPTLTLYLVGTSTYITYLAWKIMQTNGLNISSDQAVLIFQQVTSSMIYLAVSAVTWWFGDRTMSKFLQGQGAKQNKRISSTPSNPVGGNQGATKPGKKGGGGSVDF